MIVREATRGRPLIALLLILSCWILARIWFWDAAASELPGRSDPAMVADLSGSGLPAAEGAVSGGTGRTDGAADAVQDRLATEGFVRPARPVLGQDVPRLAVRIGRPAPPPRTVLPPHHAPLSSAAPEGAKVPVRTATAHQMLWLTMLQAPLPMGVAIPLSGRAVDPPPSQDPATHRRWSGDGWVLLRQGGKGPLASGAAPSSYGASQAGGVIRYRLAPESRHRSAAYLRTTAALNGSGEREAALGVSARPFGDVPVVAAAELRATAQPGGTRLRPAVMAVTELAPFALPRALRGEAYAQAGYVGGRFATPFVDAQMRVDRPVATFGRSEVRAGAGAWGGAQKGASRLDLGPGATMGMGLGGSASARVAVDWRFRIAGDAAPASGPALTLSAGF